MSSNAMVIIGAGHAGARACHTLRAEGWAGAISLIEAEPTVPYERPPLSKAVLTQGGGEQRTPLLKDGWLQEQRIHYRSNLSAIGIDRARNVVLCNGGVELPYQALLLATGAEPRRVVLPGSELGNVGYLRSAADAATLHRWLQPNAHLLIVGGGLIGLEVAASARALGCRVTVVEAGARLAQRVVLPVISTALQRDHEAAGVAFRIGNSVQALEGHGVVQRALLANGETLACSAVLLCVGATPRVALAQSCGLAVDNGIVVDKTLRTADPRIWAAGDACSFEDLTQQGHTRLECWQNAEAQAVIAARNMLGASLAYHAAPWMWSDQYQKSLQVAGYPERSQHSVARHCEDGSLLLFHLDTHGTLLGVSGYGSVREVGRGVRSAQTLIEQRVRPPAAQLADPGVNLKTLLNPTAA